MRLLTVSLILFFPDSEQITMKTLPRCCGKRMQKSVETQRFMEAWCDICDDIVYIRKDGTSRPQMLDD